MSPWLHHVKRCREGRQESRADVVKRLTRQLLAEKAGDRLLRRLMLREVLQLIGDLLDQLLNLLKLLVPHVLKLLQLLQLLRNDLQRRSAECRRRIGEGTFFICEPSFAAVDDRFVSIEPARSLFLWSADRWTSSRSQRAYQLRRTVSDARG